MTDIAGAPIVVGVDGSAPSDNAVRLAARMAAGRRRPLHIVHAFVWPLLNIPLGPPPGGPPDSGLTHGAERIVADAATLARNAEPGLEVSTEVISGTPAGVLVQVAEGAALVVLGDRGLGGFGSLMLGSVGVEVASHAPCPVVITRGQPDRAGEVLVGVDASPDGAHALAFAFDEAARRGVGIVALHAYTHPVAMYPGDMLLPVFDRDQLENEERLVLREALAGYQERYPSTQVRSVLVQESAARALVHASGEASLVVVGSRGLGGFKGLALGSVSHAVMHHAACPVAVVR